MKLLTKMLVGFVVAIALIFALRSVTTAKTYPTVSVINPTPTPVAEVNSFELFWPLSPGRVEGDSLYSLKLLKEKIRGIFIFGLPQKADYGIFLATKRIIEAEQLLKNGKTDLANQTLDNFTAELNAASATWNKVKQGGDNPVATKENMRKELNNLSIFLNFLSLKYQGDTKVKIDQGLVKVNQLLNSL